MKTKMFKVLIVLFLISMESCAQEKQQAQCKSVNESNQEMVTVPNKPIEHHKYGGWYCPDNLNGFPPTDIGQWKKVPVVNGRLATKEETKTSSALIFVDTEKYPNAKPLDITMPKLATIYERNSNRKELIIVIQAINIDNDSIVGFRYINGGNGSAKLKNIQFLSENEIEQLPKSRFVSFDISIKNTQEEIWKVLTKTKDSNTLKKIFDKKNQLKTDWRSSSNVNFNYSKSGKLKAAFAQIHYGCYYIQNDYEKFDYSEKFLLLEDKDSNITELKIVCGPFVDDFEMQQSIIKKWAQKVKDLSE